MLQQVRSALKSVVAWFIVVLLILAFAAWGVPELRSFTQRPALQVGDRGFSTAEIQNEFNREVTSRRVQSEAGYSREDAIQQGLPDQIISNLAMRSAVKQEANSLGLVMPKDLVREFLQNDERFQNPQTKKFDGDWLVRVLQQYNMSLSEFRTVITDDLLREQLVSAASAGGGAPTAFKQAVTLRDIEKRDLSYVIVTDEMAGIPEEPTPQILQAHYEADAASYMAEELRSFTLIEVTNASFENEADIDEAKLREIYEDGRERKYSTPQKRTLYQLTYPSQAEAIAAAEALRQGRTFEDLASDRGLSLEAATKTDATKRDLLDPNIAEAAFADDLETGAVAGPIKGLFGFVVLQIATITPAETQSFEDVRDEIRSSLLAVDTGKRVYDVIEQIENEQDTGAGLASAAEAAGVTARTVGPVDRFSFGPGGEIIADLPADVLNEVFDLNEGDESTAVKFADDSGYFFVAVDTVTPAAVKEFDLVADAVEADWRRQERQRRIDNAVAQIETAVSAGKTFAEAVTPFNIEPQTATIDRRVLRVDAFSDELNKQVFAAKVDALSTGGAGPNDSKAVVVVNAIRHDAKAVNKQQTAVLDQYLGYQLDQELLDAYISAVRDDLGVKTNQTQIDAIFSDG